MDLSPILVAALKRLNGALDRLEAASGRVDAVGAERRDLRDALHAMGDDRARLAAELDAALARTRDLEHATDEVALRLDRAGTALRGLLCAEGAGEQPAANGKAGT